jgi:hypothetical protein
MPRVGFEHMISVFERAKTVHALDREATVIGSSWHTLTQNCAFLVEDYTIELIVKLRFRETAMFLIRKKMTFNKVADILKIR